jgi:hypothetical protein
MRLLLVCFLIGIKFCGCDILEKRKRVFLIIDSEGQRKNILELIQKLHFQKWILMID